MGAQVTLAGLFPPDGPQKWNSYLDWQPIPVHTEPRNQDTLLSPEKRCDRFDYEMIKYSNTTEYKSLFEENQSLITDLEGNTQLELRTVTSLNHLFDKLFIVQLKGYRYVLSFYVITNCISIKLQALRISQTKELLMLIFLACHYGRSQL